MQNEQHQNEVQHPEEGEGRDQREVLVGDADGEEEVGKDETEADEEGAGIGGHRVGGDGQNLLQRFGVRVKGEEGRVGGFRFRVEDYHRGIFVLLWHLTSK